MVFFKKSLLVVVLLLSVVLSAAPQVGTVDHAQQFVSYISSLVSGPITDLDEAEARCSKALGFLDKMTDFMSGVAHESRLASSVLHLNCTFNQAQASQMYDFLHPLVSAREAHINHLLQQAAMQEQIAQLALEAAHDQFLALMPLDRWDLRAPRGPSASYQSRESIRVS